MSSFTILPPNRPLRSLSPRCIEKEENQVKFGNQLKRKIILKDLQGTTDPDTFSITSNRLLLIHVDHLELLNSSSSSRKKNTSEPLLTPPPLLSLLNPLLTGSQAAAWQVRGQAATEEESGGGERGRRRSSSFHSQLRIPCHLQCATHPKYQRDQIQDFLRDKTFSTLPPPNPALSCISHILFAIAQRFPRPRFSNQFLIENIIFRWKMFPLSYGFRSTQVHLTLHMIRVG